MNRLHTVYPELKMSNSTWHDIRIWQQIKSWSIFEKTRKHQVQFEMFKTSATSRLQLIGDSYRLNCTEIDSFFFLFKTKMTNMNIYCFGFFTLWWEWIGCILDFNAVIQTKWGVTMCSGKMQNGATQAIKLMVIIYIYFSVIHWPRLQSLQSQLSELVTPPHRRRSRKCFFAGLYVCRFS